MDRVLESTLRAAEILVSLTLAQNLPMAGHSQILSDMTRARRELALFQHHDGITGTAKELVVVDYVKRMLSGIAISQTAIAAAAQSLLLGERAGETMDVMIEVVCPFPSPSSFSSSSSHPFSLNFLTSKFSSSFLPAPPPHLSACPPYPSTSLHIPPPPLPSPSLPLPSHVDITFYHPTLGHSLCRW